MQRNTQHILIKRVLAILWSGLMMTTACAGTPLWTFEPLTATSVTVPANGTALIQYRVTNQSSKPHTLVMQSIQGVAQITTGFGVCGNPFVLGGKNSCVLSLQINGNQLSSPIVDGPVVCQQGNTNQCYRPGSNNILRISQVSPLTDAVITVTGSPLTLAANGSAGQLTINNTSSEVTATNIRSNFTGTALDGNVSETGNTCANVPPGGSCTLTYTPGNTVLPQSDFTIQGTNTNVLTAAIAIQPASTLTAINPNSGTAVGGVGVTLTGTSLSGVSGVTFGGVAATNVFVVNSTTVTAVTPPHAAGVVNVAISTPTGGATLVNGYTYQATQIGQVSSGGKIACLNGGLNNLIAATADNSIGIPWGFDFSTGATSIVDGAANTTSIVNSNPAVGPPSAAYLCNDFEVDSQGHTPCQPGNACYNDWFLPAGNNVTSTGQLYCLYANRIAIGGFISGAIYWSSTEDGALPAQIAYSQDFDVVGNPSRSAKNVNLPVRCVRSFIP